MKLTRKEKLIKDPETGRMKIKQVQDPRMNTSKKIAQKKSKKQRVVKRIV